MTIRPLLALVLTCWGCGSVVPVPRSDRAAVGWSSFGFSYCLEPSDPVEPAGPLLLGYPAAAAGSAAPSGSPPSYGVAELTASTTRGREVAEISLFARESLYRLCEARRNDDLTREEALAQRKEIMKLLRCLVATQSAHSEVALRTCVLGTETTAAAPVPTRAAPPASAPPSHANSPAVPR